MNNDKLTVEDRLEIQIQSAMFVFEDSVKLLYPLTDFKNQKYLSHRGNFIEFVKQEIRLGIWLSKE